MKMGVLAVEVVVEFYSRRRQSSLLLAQLLPQTADLAQDLMVRMIRLPR